MTLDMPVLKIVYEKSKLMPNIPHKVYVNNVPVGMMSGDEVSVQFPSDGMYHVRIQSLIPFISGSAVCNVESNVRNVLRFKDREKIWDMLFGVDIVLWILSLILTFPHPWNIVYEVFTNGYFVFWIVYEYAIRKKYFKFCFEKFKE